MLKKDKKKILFFKNKKLTLKLKNKIFFNKLNILNIKKLIKLITCV